MLREPTHAAATPVKHISEERQVIYMISPEEARKLQAVRNTCL